MTMFPARHWRHLVSSLIVLIFTAGLCLVGDSSAEDKPASKKSTTPKSKSKPAEAEPEADDSAAGSSADVDEDLSALIVPSPLLGAVDKSSRLRFAQSLRGLLQEGISVDGSAAAKRHYEAAHQAVVSDPRAAYAYGLAFLEQKNSKEALAQFRASAQHAKGTFLPALQAIAWVQFQRNEPGAGLASLTDLAKRIETSKDSWPTERDRQHTAEWLGRMLGYLTDSVASPDHPAKADDAAETVAKLLTGERLKAFEQGRGSVEKRRKQLETLAQRPVAEVVSEMNARRQSARTDVHAAEGEIKRIEEEIRDARKPFEQQIAEANLEIRSNGQKVSRSSKEIPDAEEKVEELATPRVVPNGSRTYRGVPVGMRTRAETTQERKAREGQLSMAQAHLQQLRTSIDNAKQSMADARKQREKAQADMRSAVAAKQPELREARRKNQEAAARLKDIEHAALSPEQIKARVTALDAYVPLDTFVEKNRLLETLKNGD